MESKEEKKSNTPKKSTKKSTPNNKTSVKSLKKEEIIVDLNNKFNTQPKNGVMEGFFSNGLLYFNQMFKTLIKSKLFWILLIVIPMLFTFLEYSFFTAYAPARIVVKEDNGVYYLTYFQSGNLGFSMDMLNYFLLSPLLLTSLIIFPAFIAKSRENNTLKRHALVGVTRKQTYYYYISFTTLFLFWIIIFWIGPWSLMLNFFMKNIFSNLDAITNIGNNEFQIVIGWGNDLPFGKQHQISSDNINSDNINLIVDTIVKSGFLDDYISFGDFSQVNNAIAAINSHSENIDEWNSAYYQDPITGGRNNLLFPPMFEFFDKFENGKLMFFVIIVSIIALNSYGYEKSMNSKSSSKMLGWGIGMWIFATIAGSSSILIRINVYASTWTNKVGWNYFVATIIFVVKWMFIATLPSLLIASIITSGTGLIDTSNTAHIPFEDSDQIITYQDNVINSINLAIIISSLLISLFIILNVFFKKTKIVSYESSR